MEEDFIQFGEITQDFEKHLAENPKILFSAPYGLGKTFFLKKFFEGKKQSEYIPIHLFPVNYSISSNEDVLSLLKYDILVSLLLNEDVLIELDKFNPKLTTILPKYFEENWRDLTTEIFNYVVKFKTGIDVSKATQVVIKQFDKIKDIQKKYTIDDQLEVQNFLKKHKEARIDRITEIIQNTLSVIQENKKKKVVLIIDDLDRVDPEHIFRLINVFSAYVDQDSSHNLFGFDHVIFVCDLENIKSIYHHRYGENTNFHSYIDKFYSSSPFQFDFFKILNTNIYNMLQRRSIQKKFDRGTGMYERIIVILKCFIDAKLLSTRTIFNSFKKEHNHKNEFYAIGKNNKLIGSEQVQIIESFIFINSFLGKDVFIDLAIKLEKSTYNPNSSNPLWDKIIKDCIILSNWENHNYEIINEGKDLYIEPYSIFFTLKNDYDIQICTDVFTIKEETRQNSLNFFDSTFKLPFEKNIFNKAVLEFHRLPKK